MLTPSHQNWKRSFIFSFLFSTTNSEVCVYYGTIRRISQADPLLWWNVYGHDSKITEIKSLWEKI
jgi:hypothetical protein